MRSPFRFRRVLGRAVLLPPAVLPISGCLVRVFYVGAAHRRRFVDGPEREDHSEWSGIDGVVLRRR